MQWQFVSWKLATLFLQFVAFLARVVARTSWQNVIDVLSLVALAWVCVSATASLLRGLRSVLWAVALLFPIVAFVWQSGVLTPEILEAIWTAAIRETPLPMNTQTV